MKSSIGAKVQIRSVKNFDGLEQKMCPAGVFQYDNEKLHINQENCLHCKACEIKSLEEFLIWTPPEGGGGPF